MYMLQVILSLLIISSTGLMADSASVFFDFSSNTGKASQNTFSSGVKISPIVMGGGDVLSAGVVSYQNQEAKLSAREPNYTLSFTVSIDAATTLSLDEISFDYGFDELFHPNAITPSWSLDLSRGRGLPSTGSHATISKKASPSRHENIQLKGLKNLSNTQVTFTLTFHTRERRISGLNRAHIIDNIILSGESSRATTDNSKRATLLSIVGISVIWR